MIQPELRKYYLVMLYSNTESEVFNFTDENFLEVILQQNENFSLNNHEYAVELNFTLDGLLGFGSELIRQAMDAKYTGKNQMVLPQAGEPYFYRGVHLTETSPELVPLINENLELSIAMKQRHIRRQKKAPFILAMSDPCSTLFKIDKYARYVEIINSLKNDTNNKEDQKEDHSDHCYFFNLFTNRNEIPLYEGSNNNAVQVTVKNLNTLQVYDKSVIPIIYLNLNSNGMLQLGEELIRIALKIQLQLTRQVIPFQECVFDYKDLGLYLTPGSAQLQIRIHPFNKIKTNFLSKKINKIFWQKKFELNIIRYIFDNEILIKTFHSKKESLILSMGGYLTKHNIQSSDVKSWLIPFASTEEMIMKIVKLKNENFMFYLDNNDDENTPANIFCNWRKKGIVTGRIVGATEMIETNQPDHCIIIQTGYSLSFSNIESSPHR